MPRTPSRPNGSALLLAILLLLVLSIIGAVAVSVASQERVNASAQARVEFLTACANAAQAKIWAEMAQFGLGYLGSTVTITPETLPDGTKIMAPAHYADFDPDATARLVKDVVLKHENSGGGTGASGSGEERDCTNGACGLVPLGSTYSMTAVCQDAAGRKYELELGIKFAL